MENILMPKVNYNYGDLQDHDAMGVGIKNKNGEILLQDHIKFGFWTIPIGKSKPGQSVEDGLQEEILEECAIVIQKFKQLVRKEYTYNRNGKTVTVTSYIFEVEEYSGIIKNNEPQKHRSQIFMSLDKIKTLPYLSDATILYLEHLGLRRVARL